MIMASLMIIRSLGSRYLTRHTWVGFIDILGFGNRVGGANSDTAYLDIINDLSIVQNAFEGRDNDALITASHKVMGKRVYAFSDSIVVKIPMISPLTKIQGTFDTFLSELSSLALSQAQCVIQSIFLRGGFGRGVWYKRKDLLVSPALVNAARLEKQISAPIIGLTDDLYEFLISHKDRLAYSNDPLQELLAFHVIDGREVPYLDYLRIWINEIDWQANNPDLKRKFKAVKKGSGRETIMLEGYKRNWKRALEWHRDAVQTALHSDAAKQPRVKSKYLWLRDYHNKLVNSLGSEFQHSLINS